MLLGIIALANLGHLRYVDPDNGMQQLIYHGSTWCPSGPAKGRCRTGRSTTSRRSSASCPHAVFSNFSPAFYFTIAATGIILVLAANTAFNGFPVLGLDPGPDGYLPRQLHTRGDRLAFSNGIVMLAGAAIVLIIAFDAQPTRLIQLYIVGVFVSFTLSQIGMIRHWNRHLRAEQDPRGARPDDALAGDQRARRRHDRHGPGRRAGHQVHPRRLDRDRRHGGAVRA